MTIILALIIGYLLGAINPAYILGRILKGIDIRKKGTGNAGTSNAYVMLGLIPAIITALFDLLKGVAAMFIAYSFGLSLVLIFLSGIMAIIGHVFPFYLNFKGGMGQATAIGILLVFLAGLVVNYSSLLIPLIAIVAIMVILMLLAGTIRAGIIALTLVLLMLYLYLEPISTVIFVTIISIYIIITSVMIALRKNKIKIQKPYRKLLRPLAAIFPIGYLFFSKSTVLLVLGVVLAFFMIAEALRFFRPRYLSFMYRKKEKGKISTLLLFLVASFMTILFFARDTAVLVLLFLTFGDLAAFFIGTAFGKIKLFNGKTLEGSFAFLVCCLFVGLVSLNFLDLNMFLVILGAAVATIVESIPIGEDNLTVALITALVLSAFR